MVLMFQCFSMFQKQCNMDKSIIYQSKKRSCLKFQIKKLLQVKHGQIIATISQVSMFRMFLYIINISLEHSQKVFSLSKRLRSFQLIGRQDYTSHGSCRIQSVPFQLAAFAPEPGVFATMNCSHCILLGPRTILLASRFPKNQCQR